MPKHVDHDAHRRDLARRAVPAFASKGYAALGVRELAADVAEATGTRTMDAIHLGAALRLGTEALDLLTFDVRQAAAARGLGFRVIGV
jgi:hypothetical protein